MEQRPKTIPALMLAVLRSRWQGLGRGTRFVLLAALIGAGLAAAFSARCFLGSSGCPYEHRSTPCHGD